MHTFSFYFTFLLFGSTVLVFVLYFFATKAARTTRRFLSLNLPFSFSLPRQHYYQKVRRLAHTCYDDAYAAIPPPLLLAAADAAAHDAAMPWPPPRPLPFPREAIP